MLEICGLSKSFGGLFAVEALDLAIGEGELWALLGPSGCGKTTLLRLLGGFESPDAGEIRLGGVRIDHEPPNRRACNMIFQRYALFPHLDVLGNVSFGLELKKLARAEIHRRASEALELVELSGFEKRKVSSLSGGQQQRVAIARALVMQPRVLLLDEPLAALDLKLRQKMQVELKRLQRRLGITFILVTHDQEEALTLADRICVMNAGRIEQVGAPETVYSWPETSFVAGFIGTANAFSGTSRGAGSAPETVAVDCGALGVLEVPTRVPAQFPAGTAVQVVLRPEHLRLVPEPGDLVFQGKLTDVLFKGAEYELLCAPVVAGMPAVVVRCDRSVAVPGAAVTLAFAARDARLVPRGA